MRKFETFYFETCSFDINTKEAFFRYSFDEEIYFEEKLNFGSTDFAIKNNDLEVIDHILQHIHIVLGMSYYKLAPTKKLVSKTLQFDDGISQFWEKFYQKGLGEFLYTNQIDHSELFQFELNKGAKKNHVDFRLSDKKLVPIGGGKDSLVTMSLLEENSIDYDCFIFGKTDPIKQKCLDIAGKKALLITRQLDPLLFEMNKEGYYNGHVPITGIIAFVLLLSGYLYDYKYYILSNEKSANFGNTEYGGLDVNHQYSKSLEFEKDFQTYISTYISQEFSYFSLLRGMYETKIAELFSHNCEKYFSVFSSCNRNFSIQKRNETKKWCGECPKCVFVYTILSGYLDPQKLYTIFGKNLYNVSGNLMLFRELFALDGIKPLECVGESDEMVVSFFRAIEKFPENKNTLAYNSLFSELSEKYNSKERKKIEKKLERISNDDIIPEKLKYIVSKHS